MYFILKRPTNPHEKYSSVASAVPFVIFWNLANAPFCRKKNFFIN